MTRVACWLAVCATLTAGCAKSPERRTDDIVLAIGNSPTNLDPGVGLDEASQRVQSLVFSSLLKFGDDLRIVPDLATSFETTDFQTYIATLPSGVRFHDGRPLTAADVTYTFRRFLDPKFVSARKGAYQDLASVDARDPHTVVFTLKRPTASFAANIANVGIVPDGSGPTIARAPVGSGPYRLVEFVPDDHVSLAAFTGYYRGAPKNSGLRLKVVPDATMRGLELRKGDVDLVVNDLTPDLVNGLQQQPGLKVITAPGTDFAYIGLNVQDRILADARVRQAIGYAIDRAAIVHYLQRGQARETPGLIPSMSWAYTDDIFTFTRDLTRSRALLDEAGYPDPDGDGPTPRLRLVLKTSTAEAYRVQAAAIQQQLAEAGIALEIRSYEFATLFADVVRGNVQLYTLIFTGGSVADPDILRRVFHSSQMPPAGFNRARYVNTEVDRAIDAATASLTERDRAAHYQEAARRIALDAPIIPLWARSNTAVLQKDLAGVTLSPIGDFDFLRNVHRTP